MSPDELEAPCRHQRVAEGQLELPDGVKRCHEFAETLEHVDVADCEELLSDVEDVLKEGGGLVETGKLDVT